jgi:hypothetical protein
MEDLVASSSPAFDLIDDAGHGCRHIDRLAGFGMNSMMWYRHRKMRSHHVWQRTVRKGASMRNKSDRPDAALPDEALPVHKLSAERHPQKELPNPGLWARILVITLAIVIAVLIGYFLVG